MMSSNHGTVLYQDKKETARTRMDISLTFLFIASLVILSIFFLIFSKKDNIFLVLLAEFIILFPIIPLVQWYRHGIKYNNLLITTIGFLYPRRKKFINFNEIKEINFSSYGLIATIKLYNGELIILKADDGYLPFLILVRLILKILHIETHPDFDSIEIFYKLLFSKENPQKIDEAFKNVMFINKDYN
jgi:hypothetical protein